MSYDSTLFDAELWRLEYYKAIAEGQAEQFGQVVRLNMTRPEFERGLPGAVDPQ